MKNRRDFMKASLAVPAVAAIGGATFSADGVEAHPSVPVGVMREIIRLPMSAGKVVSMTTFRDEVVIATEHGHIYAYSARSF